MCAYVMCACVYVQLVITVDDGVRVDIHVDVRVCMCVGATGYDGG